MFGMRRREFVTLIGGVAATWPLAARAQQPNRMRRVGVLIGTTETDLDGQNRLTALRKGMQELGWLDGQNAQVDVRWAASDDLTRFYAAEIVSLKPDVIVANGTPASLALRQITQTIPIVFVQVTDPVGQKLVESLARSGGNLTGFTNYEFEMGGKWLQLLKEIAPRMARAVILFHPPTAPFAGSFQEPIEIAARSLSVEAFINAVSNDVEIANAIEFKCSIPEFWLDCDTKHLHDGTARDDRGTCRTLRLTGNLPLPLLRHERWPDGLRG